MKRFTGSPDSPNWAAPTRREALAGMALGVAIPAIASAAPGTGGEPCSDRKIRLGVIGNGGRGAWIAGLFKKHGGYEIHAVADYFQDVADRCGDGLGVDKGRRFSTLSGYKRLFECGVEAVAIETPPYFMPSIASEAVQAGLHVYLAKPVATDAPGCLDILKASRNATRAKRCFLVDYQLPTDPVNQEIVKRIRSGAIGRVVQVNTWGGGAAGPDPPFTQNYESRLQKLIWVADSAMGGDIIGNFDIHSIDAALWVIGQRPASAVGASRITRPNPHGDAREVCSVIYEYENGAVHSHLGQFNLTAPLSCYVYGQNGRATLMYWGDSQILAPDDAFKKPVENLYELGAERNIAAFHRNITEGHFENETTTRAVDGALTCYLGREAAAHGKRVTMAEFLRRGRHLEVDLKGLKR